MQKLLPGHHKSCLHLYVCLFISDQHITNGVNINAPNAKRTLDLFYRITCLQDETKH